MIIKKLLVFVFILTGTLTAMAQRRLTNQLYPLKMGNQWIYEIKTEDRIYTDTEEVKNAREFFGHTYYWIESRGDKDWDYYRNTNDNEVEVVTYIDEDIKPQISGKLITKPHKRFQSGIIQGMGKEFTKADRDNTVINGFRATIRIETTWERDDNSYFKKHVTYWGAGIGMIKYQLYDASDKNSELKLSEEGVLRKVNFK